MSRTGTAFLALISLAAVAGLMIGCNGFFVSPTSLASITVSPDNAVLSSASGNAGSLTISASGTLVNGNSSSISPTWTTSDTTGAVITLSATTGSSITVTPVAGAGNQVTVTATSGSQSVTVPIDVVAGTFSTINLNNVSPTTVTPPSTVTAIVGTDSGITIPANFVDWTLPSGASINSSGVVSFSLTTTSTTATITATVHTNGNSTLTASSGTITIE